MFSFPVFPDSPGGRPSIDEMEEYSNSYSSDGDGPVLSELAAYGGHLNRFTFLKVQYCHSSEINALCNFKCSLSSSLLLV